MYISPFQTFLYSSFLLPMIVFLICSKYKHSYLGFIYRMMALNDLLFSCYSRFCFYFKFLIFILSFHMKLSPYWVVKFVFLLCQVVIRNYSLNLLTFLLCHHLRHICYHLCPKFLFSKMLILFSYFHRLFGRNLLILGDYCFYHLILFNQHFDFDFFS